MAEVGDRISESCVEEQPSSNAVESITLTVAFSSSQSPTSTSKPLKPASCSTQSQARALMLGPSCLSTSSPAAC